jgi:hypothetical protein
MEHRVTTHTVPRKEHYFNNHRLLEFVPHYCRKNPSWHSSESRWWDARCKMCIQLHDTNNVHILSVTWMKYKNCIIWSQKWQPARCNRTVLLVTDYFRHYLQSLYLAPFNDEITNQRSYTWTPPLCLHVLLGADLYLEKSNKMPNKVGVRLFYPPPPPTSGQNQSQLPKRCDFNFLIFLILYSSDDG